MRWRWPASGARPPRARRASRLSEIPPMQHRPEREAWPEDEVWPELEARSVTDRQPEPESQPEEKLQRALDAAYRYLNRRDRTETEVRQRLEQADTESGVIDEAIAVLVEQHVLDDERYARLFVEDKRALDQWGADRIRRTLRTRGIDGDVIERALGEDDSAADELGRALELLRARFPSPPQDRRERDRALGVMLRKGYDSEVAIDALATYARDAAPR